jgi:hypothetical protein
VTTQTLATKEPKKEATRPRRSVIVGVAAILSLLFVHHVLTGILSRFLFHPSRDEGDEIARVAERVEYLTSDGVRIRSWLVRSRTPRRRTVVYFHGNGGLAAGSAHWGQWLAARGSDVLLAEYRGYGASEGEPSAAGIERDAEAAIRYLLDVEHVPSRELVVHGQSLGGAAAIAALAGPARDAAGGVIESSFTSLHDMGRAVLGIPLTYVVSDAYHLNNLARAGEVRAPILQLHGDADDLIPFAQGRRLSEGLRSRRFVTIEGGQHNLASPRVPEEVRRFLEEVAP